MSGFQSAGPVVGKDFRGREAELATLTGATLDLKSGVRRLYCVLGPRKIGKTSLLEELVRRLSDDSALVTCRVDLFEANTPPLFFTHLVLGLLDAFLRKRGVGPVLSGLADDEAALTVAAAGLSGMGVGCINRVLAAVLGQVRQERNSGRHYRLLLDFPEQLARETGLFPVVIVDEFQEFLRFNAFREVREGVGDILKLLRSLWQQHRRVGYIVSGSEASILEGVVADESSPLMGHFVPLRLGPFTPESARALVEGGFRSARISISPSLVERLVRLAGAHPFYLQVLGEDLCLRSSSGVVTEHMFKETVQDCLFASTGRLQLHFAASYERHVGRSTTLERVLLAIVGGGDSVSVISRHTNMASGAVSSALGLLREKDMVVKNEAGSYGLNDPMFGLWLSGNRSENRRMAGPYHLGSDAERAVCRLLGREGFNLVYRSQASRGAFDILALLGTSQVGLQVKSRTRAPLYVTRAERSRMVEWGRQLGWIPVVVLYLPETGRALYFDVRATGRPTVTQYRFDEHQASEQLLPLVTTHSEE